MIVNSVMQSYRRVYGEDLRKVYLYGSYARGDQQPDSDVDLAAIVRGERPALQEALKKVWRDSADLELEYGTIVSPTVIPEDEFEKYREALPYYRNIVKEGVEIGGGYC